MSTVSHDLINSLIDDHIAKFPEKLMLFDDYRTSSYSECMYFVHRFYFGYDLVVQRLVCELLAHRFHLDTDEVLGRAISFDPADAYQDELEEPRYA